MSDLTATNCGCGCDNNCGGNWENNSCLWIILLLIFCGGCGNNRIGDGCGCGGDSCLWIILLLSSVVDVEIMDLDVATDLDVAAKVYSFCFLILTSKGAVATDSTFSKYL